MKNILQIVGDPVGGIRRHIHSIIDGMSDQGIQSFYVYSSIKTDKTFQNEMKYFEDKLAGTLPLSISKKPSFRDILNIFKLIIFVRKNSIHIVHGHGAKGGLYARVLKLFCNINTVYTPHGGVLHQAFSPLLDKLYVTIERMMIPLTDTLVFESCYSRDRYLEKIGTPKCEIVVNYNGVSLEKINLTGIIPQVLSPKKINTIHFGLFARLHSMKGQSLAIEAFSMIPQNYFLHLFGEGDEYDFLMSKVVKFSLQERVFFHGEVNNSEEIMSFLDGVLIPSTFESFSYVAAEALMMGIPVIASNVGGLQEVLAEESGILVDELSAFAFADTILKLFSDTISMRLQIQNGKQRYRKYFNENLMVDTIAMIYKNLSYTGNSNTKCNT